MKLNPLTTTGTNSLDFLLRMLDCSLMPKRHFIAALTAATVAVLPLGQAAGADLLIKINKSAQRMTVTADGKHIQKEPQSWAYCGSSRSALPYG